LLLADILMTMQGKASTSTYTSTSTTTEWKGTLPWQNCVSGSYLARWLALQKFAPEGELPHPLDNNLT
jgi:hypothetical protein